MRPISSIPVVAVLGCGPSGLLAAHAAKQAGGIVEIYSVRKKSEIHGAQYIHKEIPDLTLPTPDGSIHYIKQGTRQGYAKKVYGSSHAPCSWDNFAEGHYPAWRMRGTYNLLWENWEHQIQDIKLGPKLLPVLLKEYDIVISTIPKQILCFDAGHHAFTSTEVHIIDESLVDTDNLKVPLTYGRDNFIIYNGRYQDHWYRSSFIFGYESTESTKKMENSVKGIKPIDNNCTCWDGKVVFAGRFGEWKKGILSHNAYDKAKEAVSAVQQVR